MPRNLQSQQEMVTKLKTQLQQLEAKYESARANRDVLIARQRRAEAVQKVSSTMSGLKSLEPGEELDRMERRIRSNEAKALAEQDMASDSMAAQFAELDGGLEVEDDLAATQGARAGRASRRSRRARAGRTRRPQGAHGRPRGRGARRGRCAIHRHGERDEYQWSSSRVAAASANAAPRSAAIATALSRED